MNTDKVKGRMVEMHVSGKVMARELGMDQSTFYRKMKKDGKDFSVADLYTFQRVLKMDKEMAADFLLA